jgi:hypothetical protein
VRRRADPLAEVACVRERDAARDDARVEELGLGADVARAGDDDLVRRAGLAADELDLIRDEEPDVLDVLALAPAARQHVPLRGRAHDNVRALEDAQVRGRLAREREDLLPALELAEAGAPRADARVDHLRERLEADRAPALALAPQPEERELGADGLARARRRAHEHVLVGGVERLEDLRLDLVERGDRVRVQRLVLGVVQRGERERLEVEQRCRRRELGGQDEVLERDGQARLRVQPAFGHDGDVVVRRDGLRDRDGERDGVLVLGIPLPEHERVVEEDELAVDVLDEDVERLRGAVHGLGPLEVGRDREVDAQERARDRLHLRLQLQLREVVHEPVHEPARVRHPDQLPDLGRVQVEVPVPRELLRLRLPDHLRLHALELPERRHRAPHPALDHLAHVERRARGLRPPALQADLEDGVHDAPRGLLDEDHVRDEREAVELELRDVRLEEHVDLCGRLVHALLDRNRHALKQLAELELFLLSDLRSHMSTPPRPHQALKTYRDVLELVAERKHAEQLEHAHARAQVLVVRRHRVVGHIVVAGDAPELRRLEAPRRALVLEQAALLEHHRRRVHNVRALLHERRVVRGVVGGDRVERRRAQHAHVPRTRAVSRLCRGAREHTYRYV